MVADADPQSWRAAAALDFPSARDSERAAVCQWLCQ
jgi:hypothetical protein